MTKFNYKLVEGIHNDVDGFRPFHVVIISHRLLVDQPCPNAITHFDTATEWSADNAARAQRADHEKSLV